MGYEIKTDIAALRHLYEHGSADDCNDAVYDWVILPRIFRMIPGILDDLEEFAKIQGGVFGGE